MANDRPTYQHRIVNDPDILVGKPTVKGTRISVELVLAHLAENLDLTDLFAAYPALTIDDVKACLAYAGQLVTEKGRLSVRRRIRARTTLPDDSLLRLIGIGSGPDDGVHDAAEHHDSYLADTRD